MLIRAKAPLRIGIAGGGTDVNPYCDLYGGAVLNACLNMYAYAALEPRNDGKICFHNPDLLHTITYDSAALLSPTPHNQLLVGVYNRIVRDYLKKPLSFTLTVSVDAPPGSGLGSSSTLVVAVLKAFATWQQITMDEHTLAKLAWSIEREDLQMPGGRQDQYTAVFGGFNFMEFTQDQSRVQPLKIHQHYINELEFNLVLYDTGNSRLSTAAINTQIENLTNKQSQALAAAHQLKQLAYNVRDSLLAGNLNQVGYLLHTNWLHKKELSSTVSNPQLDQIYETALRAGASGGKISGAGGGGFFLFYCPANNRYQVIEVLNKLGGNVRQFRFAETGAQSWIVAN